MNNNTAIIAIAIAAVVACGAAAAIYVIVNDSDEYTVLVDAGNGITYWENGSGDGCLGAMSSAASKAGMDLSFSDGKITVDGKTSVTIGNTTTSWRAYEWKDGQWNDVTSSIGPGSNSGSDCIAVGFYPEGYKPTETPDYKTSWTMILGDSAGTSNQTATLASEGKVQWSYAYKGSFLDSTALVAGQYAYFESGGAWGGSEKPMVTCFDMATGEKQWEFEFKVGAGYEVATGVIYGDHYYLPATNENVYKIPLSGPNADGSNVKSVEIDDPRSPGKVGDPQEHGPSTIIYDSGMLYFGTGDGYVYCMDMDLNVAWKTPITGSSYYYWPTIADGKVFIGAYDGCIHVLDQYTGEFLQKVELCKSATSTRVGHTGTPAVVGDHVYMAYEKKDGIAGIAGFEILDRGIKQVFANDNAGCNRMVMLPVETEDFSGVYFFDYKVLKRIDKDGNMEELLTVDESKIHAPLTMLNGESIFAVSYDSGGGIYEIGLDGKIKGMINQPDEIKQYAMAPLVPVDNWLVWNNDKGVMVYSGHLPAPEEE